ncbi:MAG: 50S ribosomal protein L4, partial [Actinomycetota bacterium]|nr:50S ribosomal protein L4 [Actinomycetota bacterium]
GGVAHGPQPRDYAERTNKKMKRLALRSALSDRAAMGRVMVVSDWGFDQPSTRAGLQALADLGVEGKVLVVLGRDNTLAWKSMRNLPQVHLLFGDQLNTYDVLVNDYVVFDRSQLPGSAGGEDGA